MSGLTEIRAVSASAVVRQSRAAPYRSLDAWRGIAALWVAVFHTSLVIVNRFHPTSTAFYALFLQGQLGVQIFFVISGYCILNAAQSAMRRDQGLFIFMKARLRRIYPTFWFALLLTLILSLLASLLVRSGQLQHSTLGDKSLGSLHPLSLIANLSLTAIPLHQPLIVMQSWTLCYEMAFYLIVGAGILLSVLIKTSAHMSWRLADGLHLITAICLLALIVAPRRVPFPLDLWPQFGLGALVYDLLHRPGLRTSRFWLGLIFVETAILVLWHTEHIGPAGQPCRVQYLAALIYALLLIVLHPLDARLSASPWIRPLALIGIGSYSLYLTHTFSIGLISQAVKILKLPLWLHPAAFLACIAGALLFAWLFHLLCERPFLSARTQPLSLADPVRGGPGHVA